MKRRRKPRDWAADVVRGDVTIDDVPKDRQHWVAWHIRAVADQIERRKREEKR